MEEDKALLDAMGESRKTTSLKSDEFWAMLVGRAVGYYFHGF